LDVRKQEMPRSKQQTEPGEQSKRFIETARALECDEDEAAFDEKLKRIATANPKREKTRKPSGSRGRSKTDAS
jgi:hypothetical protein